MRRAVYLPSAVLCCAVQVLPIPELMPFRLTRAVEGALLPHSAHAVLLPPMTALMGCLAGEDFILDG